MFDKAMVQNVFVVASQPKTISLALLMTVLCVLIVRPLNAGTVSYGSTGYGPFLDFPQFNPDIGVLQSVSLLGTMGGGFLDWEIANSSPDTQSSATLSAAFGATFWGPDGLEGSNTVSLSSMVSLEVGTLRGGGAGRSFSSVPAV